MFDKAYIEYLIQFHCQRDYFECHEILEERWKLDRKEDRKRYWVGLIQIAVGMYHYRRKNWNGARKMFTSAKIIVKEEYCEFAKLGIIVDDLITLLERQLMNIHNRLEYHSISLPLIPILLNECCTLSKEAELTWGASSDLTNTLLVHKHKRSRI